MNILAICSALDNSYFGFKIGEITHFEAIKSDANYHSLYLISKIKETFKSKGVVFSSLEAITVNVGPGSFTGIRLAMTIAKVMAGELNIPLIPLNTAEILLNYYNADNLIMDARRDMFFIGSKDKIELIYKDKVDLDKLSSKVITDNNCSELVKNSICFEKDDNKNLAKTMIDLAQKKFNSTEDKNEFNYLKIEANYIQTPPVF